MFLSGIQLRLRLDLSPNVFVGDSRLQPEAPARPAGGDPPLVEKRSGMTERKELMIKLAVSGCLGRMGQRIASLALEDKSFKIVSLLENKEHPDISRDRLQSVSTFLNIPVSADSSTLKGAQVLIEFTTPVATLEHLEICKKYKVKMVIGTTGFSGDQIQEIKKASKILPIVFSSNMSVGVNVLFKLAKEAAARFGPDYQVKIIEAHHVHKKDAPSGTAKTIAEIIEQSSQRKISDIQSIREGETIGDHQIIFESVVDNLTISHHAKTRDIFAKGALVAAKFLAKKQKGLFSMQDVLGI